MEIKLNDKIYRISKKHSDFLENIILNETGAWTRSSKGSKQRKKAQQGINASNPSKQSTQAVKADKTMALFVVAAGGPGAAASRGDAFIIFH